MVRPKKKNPRNLEIVRLRGTESEKSKLEKAAEKAGKTLADYVRSKLGLTQEHYGDEVAKR
jgi:uncharacterized protein (DUF1778 family)